MINVLSNPQTEIVPSSLTDFQTGIGGSASVAWSTTVQQGTGEAITFSETNYRKTCAFFSFDHLWRFKLKLLAPERQSRLYIYLCVI